MNLKQFAIYASIAGILSGCDPSPTIENPGDYKTERISDTDTTKAKFMYINGLRIPKEPVKVPVAKLTNADIYCMSVGDNAGATVFYRIVTFNYQNSKHRFLSHKTMDYSPGSTFSIEYWELPKGVQMTDSLYFETFIDLKRGTSVHQVLNKTIDENVEGVIKSMKRIEE